MNTQDTKQPRRKTIFDHVWEFFSSVKVGITIIVLIAIGSVLGTIYPQTNAIPSPNPQYYYMDTYGKLGDLYYRLGLADTFTSWWFLVLVLMLAISLIIVSIDRGVPLYRSLKNQPVARKVIAIRSDRLYANKEEASEADLTALGDMLKKQRYKIRQENGALLAEKGRFPRFGAYIIHLGLIIIILGVFSRLIPGWYYTDMVWLKEGERKDIPQVGFGIENHGFQLEYYPDSDRVKKYETDAVVYDLGRSEPAAKKHLIVNDPLKYNNTLIYQNSFDPNPMFKSAKIELIEKATNKSLGTFEINFDDPAAEYKVGDFTLKMINYFPDIQIDKDKGVFTKSRDPYNPGIMFDITGPGYKEPSKQWMLPMAPFVEQMLGQQYKFSMKFVPDSLHLYHMTGLKLEKDLGVPIVYTGLAVVLWGLVLVFYFQHRRVWARLEEGVLHIGGNTNKNWLGMTKEFNRALTPLAIEPVVLKSKGKEA